MKYIGNYNNYPIYISNRLNKKYSTQVGHKFIHFGDKRYEHYFDKMGYYSHLNHNDDNRRRLYYKRHGKYAKPGTAKYFSHNILW